MGRKGRKQPPGTWVTREMIKSRAYLSLTGKAPQVLMIFMAKRQMRKIGRKGKECWQTINAKDINFPYLEAKERYGFSNKQFARAIDQLLAHGFIILVHLGGRNRSDQSVYGISERWRNWRPGEIIETRPKPESRGYRKPKKEHGPERSLTTAINDRVNEENEKSYTVINAA